MFLGVDLGTSGVKAVAVDEQGEVAAQGAAALSVQRPHQDWSEQDPDSWWTATEAAITAIDPAVRRLIRGIGIAGQMHGATLLGADDRPLRAAILWNDGRSTAQCAVLEKAVPTLREQTGNIAMPGFTAPKLLWVRDNEPEIFGKIKTVLLPKDYIRLRMTGQKASDVSDAAGTLWLDVAKRAWSEEILDACGLSLDHMPQTVEGTDIAGNLRADLAERWGIPVVPLVGGGGDNAAGAAGVGVVSDGDALISLGTSGVIFVANDRFRPNPARAVHAFCHCLPDIWHQMSVHLSAASCVDWAARLIGVSGAAEFFDRAESFEIGAGPEIFLPYLSGERTPHNDTDVRAGFLHLDNDTTPEKLAQSVLEGVAFALADGLDALRDAGTEVKRLSVIGGGARSRHWGNILSAALNVELDYLHGGEVGPALGAARMARFAVESGEVEETFAQPPISHTIRPDRGLIERLGPKMATFRDSYSRITPRSN